MIEIKKIFPSAMDTLSNYNKKFGIFTKKFPYLLNEKLFYFNYVIVINLTFLTILTLIFD
jgi:hypothetical protein